MLVNYYGQARSADKSAVVEIRKLLHAGLITDEKPAPSNSDGYQEKVAIEPTFLS